MRFYNYGNDGQCMQKIKGEITCKTYLDLADDLRNDEECCFLDQMDIPREILDVVMPQSITQAPSSTCPIKEQSEYQTNEQDLENTKRTSCKNS